MALPRWVKRAVRSISYAFPCPAVTLDERAGELLTKKLTGEDITDDVHLFAAQAAQQDALCDHAVKTLHFAAASAGQPEAFTEAMAAAVRGGIARALSTKVVPLLDESRGEPWSIWRGHARSVLFAWLKAGWCRTEAFDAAAWVHQAFNVPVNEEKARQAAKTVRRTHPEMGEEPEEGPTEESGSESDEEEPDPKRKRV